MRKCKPVCVSKFPSAEKENKLNLVFLFSCVIDMNKFFEKHI